MELPKSKRKAAGCCLIKDQKKNFKPKLCIACGTEFAVRYPNQKYCSDECRKYQQEQNAKVNQKRANNMRISRTKEYNRAHRFCPICGKPLLSGNQKVHFDCMVDKLRSEGLGRGYTKTKKWFYNHGYDVKDLRELIGEQK